MAVAGTVVETSVGNTGAYYFPALRIDLAWTCDAAGAVTEWYTRDCVRGRLSKVVFNPGTAAPTDNYDVTLLDTNGVDVLQGLGANRDTANTETVVPAIEQLVGATTALLPVVVCDKLQLVIANAGNAKEGVISLYIEG
jgi:hypothetical protein